MSRPDAIQHSTGGEVVTKYAIPCLCGRNCTIVLLDGEVWVAAGMASRPPQELTPAVPAPKLAKRSGKARRPNSKPLPCRKCGRVFFYGGARHQHERRCGKKGA